MVYHYNLADLFRSIAFANKNQPALTYQHIQYSYEQLEQDAAKIAHYLLADGLVRGDVIAIINNKDYMSYVLMLACLKIGVIYTNVDPDAPGNWVASILECCHPKLIYVDTEPTDSIRHAIAHLPIKTNATLTATLNRETTDTFSHAQSLDGNAIAYIMFTSGSTGKPKGVAITHQSLLHFISWGTERYKVGPGDIFANVSPMYFDNSVFDFYIGLFSGACLAPIHKNIVANPKKLVDYVSELQCTIWFSVPSLLIYLNVTKVLTPESFSTLRVITFGGEGYPKSELYKIYQLFKNRITFINVYGPTECTCICSSYTISDHDFISFDGLPSLGYINPNISFLILDEQGKQDTSGELCLLGPNVAVGYYNDLERTQASFSYYTGHGFYQAKMYKTGDLVKLENNLLYFLGRKDNQIKHMGYRIELESIEVAISTIAAVREVAVVYTRTTAAYGKILAFIATDNPNLSASDIRAALTTLLPTYMIPNQFEFSTHLPKNANGKIDRAKLKNVLIAN